MYINIIETNNLIFNNIINTCETETKNRVAIVALTGSRQNTTPFNILYFYCIYTHFLYFILIYKYNKIIK